MAFGKIKIIDLSEFEKLIKEKLRKNWENEKSKGVTGNLIAYIMENGFPKFDKSNLKVFMNGLTGTMWVETVLVDFGDSTFYWFVSGSDAILVSKKEMEII
jgi:hypothetical protein